MEAQRINSVIFDNELRADLANLEYRAGFPRTQETGKTRESALEPRSSRGPKASLNGILAHVDEHQWGRVTKYFDEITHAELPGHLVKAARAEDIE